MREIKGVAFDLEGTVVNVEPAHHLGRIFSALEAGVDLLDLDLTQVGPELLSNPDFLERVQRKLSANLSQVTRTLPYFIGGGEGRLSNDQRIAELSGDKVSSKQIRERKDYYYGLLLGRIDIKPRPGALEVIHWLQSHEYRTAIGSLTRTEQARYLLTKSGLIDEFNEGTIILKEDVAHTKPAPDVWLMTAERMGINPQKQLVFEDSPTGIEAALAAGSMTIGIPVYDQPSIIIALITAGASRVFADWREMNIEALINNLALEDA